MRDERRQALLDDAIEREQRDNPKADMNVLASDVTDVGDEYVVYLLFTWTTPEWETDSGIYFPESTSIRYSVRPSTGGGSGGMVIR